MYRRLTLLVTGVVLLSTVSLYGQDAVLGQMYGNGVHAYYAGQLVDAHGYFTSAIDGGIKDPRCYYFRGLTCLQLGREVEAKGDFQKGAGLEAADVNNRYRVGRSMERIQGSTRRMLETYRANARMKALQRAETERKLRYGQLREEEDRILGEQGTPPAAAPQPADVPAVPQPGDVPAVPQPPDEPAAPEPADVPAVPEPAVPPVPPAFGEEPADMPTEPEPAEKPDVPIEKPAAPTDPDPFGKPGAKPADEPEPADMPEPADTPDPANPDPFGGPAAKPGDMPEPADTPDPAAPAAEGKATGVLDALFKAAAKTGGDAIDRAGRTATKAVKDATGGGATEGAMPPGGFDAPPAPADKPAPPGADPFGGPAAEPAPADMPDAPDEPVEMNPVEEKPADPAPGMEPSDPFAEEPVDKPAEPKKAPPADPFG